MALMRMPTNVGGGGSEFEIQEVSLTGSNAGIQKITSETGKSPYFAQMYNDTLKGTSNAVYTLWSSTDANNFLWGVGSSGSAGRSAVGTSTGTTPNVKEYDSTSITFRCPTNSTYYTGTFKCAVVFK